MRLSTVGAGPDVSFRSSSTRIQSGLLPVFSDASDTIPPEPRFCGHPNADSTTGVAAQSYTFTCTSPRFAYVSVSIVISSQSVNDVGSISAVRTLPEVAPDNWIYPAGFTERFVFVFGSSPCSFPSKSI